MLRFICSLLLALFVCINDSLCVYDGQDIPYSDKLKNTVWKLEQKIPNDGVCVIGFNAGRGNCFLHVNKEKKDVIVVDCGTHNSEIANLVFKLQTVVDTFVQSGYTLSCIVISHDHKDHKNLLGNIEALYSSYGQKPCIITVENNEGNERIKIVDVTDRGKTPNSQSLVVYIDGVIYPGDLDGGTLALDNITPIYGLIFPHHGSVTAGSRQVRNQVIEKMNNLKIKPNQKFFFVPNNNQSICVLRMSERTSIQLSGNSDLDMSGLSLVNPEPTIVNDPTLPYQLIITGAPYEGSSVLAHCAIFSRNGESPVQRLCIIDKAAELKEIAFRDVSNADEVSFFGEIPEDEFVAPDNGSSIYDSTSQLLVTPNDTLPITNELSFSEIVPDKEEDKSVEENTLLSVKRDEKKPCFKVSGVKTPKKMAKKEPNKNVILDRIEERLLQDSPSLASSAEIKDEKNDLESASLVKHKK